MKSILIIAITALVLASFLIGRYLLKDLIRLFWKHTTYLFSNYNATFYGELGVTIVIIVLLGVGAAAVQWAAAALFALATTSDIAEFCMTFRGVFNFHSSEIQSPSQHLLWLFVSPLFKLLSIFVLVWSIKVFFLSLNKRFHKAIYSESDCFYFSLIGVAFMFGVQVVLLTQSIDTLNMVFNCLNIILQNLSYFVYFFSTYWIITLKSSHQLTKNIDKFLITGNLEKKIITTPWMVMSLSYVVSIVLTLPSYLGLQWQHNNLILISMLTTVVFGAVIITKVVFSKSWNYLATIMFYDSTLENPIKKTVQRRNLDRRWHYALYALAGIVILVFSLSFPKPMFMFIVLFLCFVFSATIMVLSTYGIFLLIGVIVTSIRKKNQVSNNSFGDFAHYIKNTLASLVQTLTMGSGIVFLAFLLITIFPKSIDYSNIYLNNISVVDPNGEVLMIDEEHDKHYSVPISYEEIPSEFVKLLILNEDRGFTHQDSFLPNKSNWHGLSPAILKRGGSNINCQIVKQLTFKDTSGYPRDGMRKLSDQLGSYQLSLKYDNQELIEIYSNVSSFNGGRGPVGINAGALYTFGRPIGKINTLEMWYLISTLPRSSYLTDGKKKIAYTHVHEDPELVKNILMQKAKKLKEDHLLSNGEYWQLCDDSLRFTNTRYKSDIPKSTRLMLEKYFKKSPGRIDCYLTIENENALEAAYTLLESKDVFRKNSSELQVAALVVEASSGKIIGHFSSSEVLDYANEYTYPIGSLGKPAIILELLKAGAPLDFRLFDGKVQSRKTPHDSHGWSNRYVGLETILSKSLNAPFSNIYDLGLNPRSVFQNLEKDYASMNIAIDTVSPNDSYNYPLGLREMKVADIAQIYQTIFNNGVFTPLTLARNNDTVISNRIWDENHVTVVKSALRQTIESNGGTLHRYKNDLPAGRTFYGKTGTSSRQKDFWTVLSDGKIVIVSWASYGKQNQGRMVFGTEKSWGASAAGLFAVLIYNELLKTHNF